MQDSQSADVSSSQKNENIFQKEMNRSEIAKFVEWCKYKQERSYYQQSKQKRVPLQYEAGNFYSVNQNFNMRLQINVERAKNTQANN